MSTPTHSGRRFAGALLSATALAQVDVTLTSAPGTANLGPGFTAETAWLFNGTLPGPVLRVTQGQPLTVHYRNQLAEDSIVHWHGEPVTLGQDGMAGISRPAVAPGQELRYTLPNLLPGTYWYHPHSEHHEQLDRGLYGVLIVYPANPADDPLYDVDQVIVLDDWQQPFGGGYDGYLLNGKTSLGQAPIVVQPGQRLRLRFLNASARTTFVAALDGHPLTVTHGDGNRLQPVVVQALPIAVGERWDAIVDCNNPGVWSLAVSTLQNRATTLVRGVVQYAGQTGAPPAATFVPPNLSGGALLSYAQLASYWPSPISAPTRTAPMNLSMAMVGTQMVHTINGQVWPNITPTQVQPGDVVQLDFASLSMGNHGYHPMHLHGHSFRLLGTAGGTTHAPLKDIVLVRPMGQPGSTQSVQFTADNPGRWMLHCHDLMHMMSGMVTLIDYAGDVDGDGIADVVDMEPTATTPVLTIPSVGAAFVPGGSGAIAVQWQPGQWCDLWVSLFERSPPLVYPLYGALGLAGPVQFATATVAPNGTALFPYVLPAAPSLSGFAFPMQALAGTALPGGLRLSTLQSFAIR